MQFTKGETVLYSRGGLDLIVEIVSGPDESNFYVVRSEGRPNFPVSAADLKLPAPELEIAKALPNLAVGAASEWVTIINQLSKEIVAARESLGIIIDEVKSGKRKPDSIMEVTEREMVASLLQTIEQHRKSLIRAMRRDSESGE